MVNLPTWIPCCDSHSPALLDFFLPSDTNVCSEMAFLSLGNSDHVIVSVSMDFLSNSNGYAPFHWIAYVYSHADLGGLHDLFRDVPWEDLIKLGSSGTAS